METVDKSHSKGIPIAELEIDTTLVSSLLSEQHPDLMYLPIHLVDSGWDNIMFRLGDHLSVRLPRRQAAAKLIENEQTWLPLLAPQLTIPVPTPCRIGEPTLSYPWCWSVLPWLAGVAAEREEPNVNQAKIFASFLRSLHMPAPVNAPVNALRGIPLIQRAVAVEERMQRLETKTNLITHQLRDTWNIAVNAPVDVEAKLLHGDLHPGNILVKNGQLSGVIDWGDITTGDIATDLASLWMLFSSHSAREQALAEYQNVSEVTIQRARGWAIFFGVVLLDAGLVNSSRQAVMGERILRHVSEEV